MVAGFPLLAALSATIAGVSFFVSWLTLQSLAAPKCAGANLVAGYLSSTPDIFAVPLFSVFAFLVLIHGGVRRETHELLASATADVTVFQLGRWSLNYAQFLIYGSGLGLVGTCAIAMGWCIYRFQSLAAYCSG